MTPDRHEVEGCSSHNPCLYCHRQWDWLMSRLFWLLLFGITAVWTDSQIRRAWLAMCPVCPDTSTLKEGK